MINKNQNKNLPYFRLIFYNLKMKTKVQHKNKIMKINQINFNQN